MIWLERPPWAKWFAVTAFSLLALWLEIMPEPVTDHPFATTDIEVGEEIGPHNTELRPIPEGLLKPPETGALALVAVPSGTPVLSSQTGDEREALPSGWWIVTMDVPPNAVAGDRVKVVLLDNGELIDGVVSSTGLSDGLEVSLGAVAVRPEVTPRVAAAASNGRVSVLVSTG